MSPGDNVTSAGSREPTGTDSDQRRADRDDVGEPGAVAMAVQDLALQIGQRAGVDLLLGDPCGGAHGGPVADGDDVRVFVILCSCIGHIAYSGACDEATGDDPGLFM